jgi:hypothetical protein
VQIPVGGGVLNSVGYFTEVVQEWLLCGSDCCEKRFLAQGSWQGAGSGITMPLLYAQLRAKGELAQLPQSEPRRTDMGVIEDTPQGVT